MLTVHETEIDGVLCFWVETGRPTLSARMIFRQGTADEPLHESGWLRLLEHLCTHDRSSRAIRLDGSVSTLLTSFDLEGSRDAVVGELARLSHWLGEPDFSQLAREVGALRARAESANGSFPRALTQRYGAVGPGVAGFAEAGTLRAGPEALAERSRRVFNRANAILVLDGPPPASLTLPLPAGEFLAATPAPIVSSPPAAYVENAGLVMTGTVRPTLAATFLPELLDRATFEELRRRAGGGYAPWSAHERMDERHAVVACGSELVPELLPHIAEAGLELARRLAHQGVPDGWLSELVDARLQELKGPGGAYDVALQAARAALHGDLPKSHEELVEALHAVDTSRVQTAAEEFASSLLLGVPESATFDVDLPMPSFPEVRPADAGRRHRHVNWPAETATFSADLHSIQCAEGDLARLVPVDQVVALFAWRDGTRHVVGRDGWSLRMEPRQWHQGSRLTVHLDRTIPEHLRLTMPDRVDTFRRMTWAGRWSAAGARFAGSTAGLVVVLAFCVVVGLLGLTLGHGLTGAFFLLIAAGVAALLLVRRRAAELAVPD